MSKYSETPKDSEGVFGKISEAVESLGILPENDRLTGLFILAIIIIVVVSQYSSIIKDYMIAIIIFFIVLLIFQDRRDKSDPLSSS